MTPRASLYIIANVLLALPAVVAAGDPVEVSVSDSSEFEAAIAAAAPHQMIVLEDGTYGGEWFLNVQASAEEPLIVRARNPLKAVLTGWLAVIGRNIHVKGLKFDGIQAGLSLAGDDHKAIGNLFTGWGTDSPALQPHRGTNAEIAYNTFTRPDPFTSAGEPSSYPLRMGIRSSHRPNAFHTAAWVHHNWFHDFPAKPDPSNYHSGQSDAIEVCYTGTNEPSGWLIEYNLVENHRGGHGIIDVKCAGGILVQHNTIINSPDGRIDFRNGDNGRLVANWIENSGGISISAENHEIIGNIVQGAGSIFALTSGTDPEGLSASRKAASHNLVSCNTGPLSIGRYDGSYPSVGNTVRGHNGSVSLLSEQDTTIVEEFDCVDVPEARALTSSEVGAEAYWAKQTWRGWDVFNAEGDLDTGEQVGWINVSSDPWLYLYTVKGWAYAPGDPAAEKAIGWLYLTR